MKKVKIGDFIESFGDGIHGTPKYCVNGQYAFINGNNLIDGKIKIDSNTLFIDKDEYEKIKRPLSSKTILISINGTLGKIAFYNGEDIALGKSACYLNVKDECYKEFLKYVMSTDTFHKYIYSVATGSTIKNLAPSQILSYEFELPSDVLSIGAVLSNIDDKISNNNRINAKLESMAKTIYDYWFTQFDFPDENGKPYKSSGGKMVWNEELKREIPEGWGIGNIGDLFESQAGYAFKSEEWRTFGHPVLTIKCINENGTININDSSFIDDYNPKMKKYSVENGNMIFAMSGNTIGKLGIISSSIANILINQRVLILRTNAKTIAFPYFILKNDKIQNSIRQLGANSAQPNISEDAVRSIKICLPTQKMLNSYNNYCETLFEKIILNQIENQQLSSLRDWLLPMLMNGQVGFEGVE